MAVTLSMVLHQGQSLIIKSFAFNSILENNALEKIQSSRPMHYFNDYAQELTRAELLVWCTLKYQYCICCKKFIISFNFLNIINKKLVEHEYTHAIIQTD